MTCHPPGRSIGALPPLTAPGGDGLRAAMSRGSCGMPSGLCLGIAGEGLLTIWPRFLLLGIGVSMLFLYAAFV